MDKRRKQLKPLRKGKSKKSKRRGSEWIKGERECPSPTHTEIQTEADKHSNSKTNLMAFRKVESDTPCILDRFTDQCISAREQQCLLDARRVITDYIHHKLHVLRILYLPVQYIHRPHMTTDQNTSQITQTTTTISSTIMLFNKRQIYAT